MGYSALEQQKMDNAVFDAMVKELDEGIDKCMNVFYQDTLCAFEKLLNSTCEPNGSIPTLFIRGNCLDWKWLFAQIKSSHPDLTIKWNDKPFKGAEVEFVDASNTVEKLFVFLHFNLLVMKEWFTRIFSYIKDIGSVFICIHTQTSLADIENCIPRTVFAQMHVHSAHLPTTEFFIRDLFADQHGLSLGLMRKHGVQIHGKTLFMAQRLFHRELRSLSHARKALILAFHDYAVADNHRPLEKKQKQHFVYDTFAEYSSLLDIFVGMMDGLMDRFELHCQIQSEKEFFAKIYSEQKEKWKCWPIDTWRFRLRGVHEKIKEYKGFGNMIEEFEELMAKLEGIEHQKDDKTSGSENDPPLKNSPSLSTLSHRSSLKRAASKSSQFLSHQQRLRNRLTKPLAENLRSELLDFLDSLFLDRLCQFQLEFIVGPGELQLLNPSLSNELDNRLGMGSKCQLDITRVYHLLVNCNSDSYSIPLATLEDAFGQLDKDIDGLDVQARFMAAISQLEHVGAVRLVSEGIVRLIYLPAATLTKDLFESGQTSSNSAIK